MGGGEEEEKNMAENTRVSYFLRLQGFFVVFPVSSHQSFVCIHHNIPLFFSLICLNVFNRKDALTGLEFKGSFKSILIITIYFSFF